MEKFTKLSIVVLGVMAIVFGTLYFATPPTPPFGAVPVLTNPLEVNGSKIFFANQKMKTATTTICALGSPKDATSTLQSVTVNVVNSSTTAPRLTVAKATTAFATTTLIGSTLALSANAKGTFFYTGSTTVDITSDVYAPGTFIVVGMDGGGGTFSPTGTCNAIFNQTN